ncbi:MAG: hypothetical protein E7293_04685 [Lachnospiraceae bacterium]|nr:hypothetical protein [Lachnospiraceae bacterium]
MLNEEKIILMTKLASYEGREGKKNGAVSGYFRSDYISLRVIESLVSAALAFVICFALYIFYYFEEFMENIYRMDLLAFAQTMLRFFLIWVAGYGLVSYVVYSVRYSRVKKQQKKYYNNLKKLAAMYEK